MKRYVHFPKVEGQASRQAHADLPAGTYEREISKEGFFGPAAHLYHRHPPTGWVNFEGPLRPHAFDCTKLTRSQDSPWAAPGAAAQRRGARALLALRGEHAGAGAQRRRRRAAVRARRARRALLRLRPPVLRGRRLPADPARHDVARRVRASRCSRCSSRPPTTPTGCRTRAWSARTPSSTRPCSTRRASTTPSASSRTTPSGASPSSGATPISTVTYPFNPLDAVGWHGDLCVVRINVRDLRPLMSHRYHLPPSAHTTFLADRFVVCSFVPRPFESDPGAMKVPFFHNNDDYDEVIFYHAGNFFSRDNIHPGMITLHPGGFTHGPHPKALQERVPAGQARHRRIRRDDRHARRARDLAAAPRRSSGPATSTAGRRA